MSAIDDGGTLGQQPDLVDSTRITPANGLLDRLVEILDAIGVQVTKLAEAAAHQPVMMPPLTEEDIGRLMRETQRPDAVFVIPKRWTQYQQRVLQERNDVTTKLAALRAVLEAPEFGSLPSEECEAMLRQLEAMDQYEDALTDRLRLWEMS